MKKKLTTTPAQITPVQQERLSALRYSVMRAEGKGNFDTAHHTMLARLESELGLIPVGKIEEKEDEVTNGESNS